MSTLLAGLWLALAAQSEAPPPPNGESFALLHGLARASALEFRVPVGPAEEAAGRLAQALSGQRELVARVLAPDAPGDPRAVRALAGSPADPALAPLARACGLEPTATGFACFGRSFEGRGDAAVAVLEDPLQAGRPLVLYLANDLSALAAYLDEVPRLSRPYLAVHADGELALTCPLEPDGRPRVELVRDFLARREQHFAAALSRSVGGFTLRAREEPDAQRWSDYSRSLAAVQRRVLGWFGHPEGTPPPTVELFVYDHPEDLEWCFGTSELALVNRLRPRLHVLLAPGMPDDDGQGLARVLARELAGAPVEPWMADGLAVAAAGRWWNRPLQNWIGHLALGRNLPELREILLPAAGAHLSPHVLMPARGFLMQLLIQGVKSDPRLVRAAWKGADLQAKKMAAGFTAGVARAAKAQAAQAGSAQALRARLATTPVRRGLVLVEGPGAGYGSRATGEALDEAQAFGAGPDAVALSVLAWLQDPLRPLVSLRGTPLGASASDVALATAVAGARGRGARVLLALEVLTETGASWADALSWGRPTDMGEFFTRYTRVALHYALLSELLAIEVFSLGGNLRDGARTEPREAVKDPGFFKRRAAGWKSLIGRLRTAYRGGLTYTSRFPAEAQEVGFFDELDFISVALFPRFVGAGPPSDAELVRLIRFELEKALELAVRWNKPLLVTQVGFPARAESWARSVLPRGAVDPEPQRRFLEALAEVLAGRLENGPALRGFYLWNWPLDAARAHGAEGGFSLRGKPVGAALTRLFTR